MSDDTPIDTEQTDTHCDDAHEPTHDGQGSNAVLRNSVVIAIILLALYIATPGFMVGILFRFDVIEFFDEPPTVVNVYLTPLKKLAESCPPYERYVEVTAEWTHNTLDP